MAQHFIPGAIYYIPLGERNSIIHLVEATSDMSHCNNVCLSQKTVWPDHTGTFNDHWDPNTRLATLEEEAHYWACIKARKWVEPPKYTEPIINNTYQIF